MTEKGGNQEVKRKMTAKVVVLIKLRSQKRLREKIAIIAHIVRDNLVVIPGILPDNITIIEDISKDTNPIEIIIYHPLQKSGRGWSKGNYDSIMMIQSRLRKEIYKEVTVKIVERMAI